MEKGPEFQKESSDQLKTNMLEALEEIKNEWSNEPPEVIVDGKNSEYKNSKYRKNWFAGAVGFCITAAEKNLLSREMADKTLKVTKRFMDEEFKKQLTKEEDIQEMDNLLEDVIEDLKRE